jgi:hypothetical protein
VADDLPDLEFGGTRFDHAFVDRSTLWPMLEAFLRINLRLNGRIRSHVPENIKENGFAAGGCGLV